MHIDNHPHCYPSSPITQPFYEVWYFKVNQFPGGAALWMRWTTLRTRHQEKKSEAWAILFEPTGPNSAVWKHFAVKQTFPLESLSWNIQQLTLGACTLGPTFTRGEIKSQGRTLHWDLRFKNTQNTNDQTFSHVPPLLKKLHLTKSSVTSPWTNLTLEGSFGIDGKEYLCQDSQKSNDSSNDSKETQSSKGMQGHIEGTKMAHQWAWAHCNQVDDAQPFAFEILSVQVLLGGRLPSPMMTALYVKNGEEEYHFNSLLDLVKTKSTFNYQGLEFEGRKGKICISGKIRSSLPEFAAVHYEDTDGSSLYCHNSKVSTLELEVRRGGELVRKIRGQNSCAFEVVNRKKHPEITLLI